MDDLRANDDSWMIAWDPHCAAYRECGLCANRQPSRGHWEILVAGNSAGVCDGCAKQVAPELLLAVNVANSALELFARRQSAANVVLVTAAEPETGVDADGLPF